MQGHGIGERSRRRGRPAAGAAAFAAALLMTAVALGQEAETAAAPAPSAPPVVGPSSSAASSPAGPVVPAPSSARPAQKTAKTPSNGGKPTAATPTKATTPVKPLLNVLLEKNHRLAGVRHQLSGAEAGVAKAKAGWWGDVNASVYAGHETISNPGTTANTKASAREAAVSYRQPLLDFGRIGGDIDKSDHLRRQAEANVRDAAQDVLLDGLTALVNIDRTRKVSEHSLQSVRNIERQTGMEESRVELGGGYATDVLQAKSQLAGANARYSRARGAVVAAANRFETLFYQSPPQNLGPVVLAARVLPKTLDDALVKARANNPQLEVASLGVEAAKAEVRRVRGAELAPRVDAIAEYSAKHNVSGTMGDKETQTYKIQMSMPFNLGMAPIHSVNQAGAALRAAQSTLDDKRRTVDQQVADAWQNLMTARETLDFFENQVRIAAEFLELARVERQQGRRSLIDVLSGETSLFNAKADAAAAAGDTLIASFSLLRSMGALDPNVIQ